MLRECQAPWNVSSKETRQTEGQGSCLLTKPSDASTDYVHGLDRGPVWRTVGSYRNFILVLRVISTFYRLPSTMSRRVCNQKKTLEMTNELEQFFVGFLLHISSDNFRISSLVIFARYWHDFLISGLWNLFIVVHL